MYLPADQEHFHCSNCVFFSTVFLVPSTVAGTQQALIYLKEAGRKEGEWIEGKEGGKGRWTEEQMDGKEIGDGWMEGRIAEVKE